jgi:hypothetical protein
MDGPVEPGGGGHYDPNFEPRLSRVEHDVRDLKETLAELKTLAARTDARLGAMDAKLGAMDAKLGSMDARLDAKLGAMDARLDATLPHLATKADLAQLEVKLADKPGKTYMWGILAALLTAYACGLAALAVLK